eukprot:2377628-Amphidinium_carterae.1
MTTADLMAVEQNSVNRRNLTSGLRCFNTHDWTKRQHVSAHPFAQSYQVGNSAMMYPAAKPRTKKHAQLE